MKHSHSSNYACPGIGHTSVSDTNTTPTLIIGSSEMKNNALTLDDYHRVNTNIEIKRINHGSLYPHLEIPEKITTIIDEFI